MTLLLPARRSKYSAKAIVVDGVRFHSTGEHRRWCELKLRERAGEIEALHRQMPIALHVGRRVIGRLVIDFYYFERIPLGRIPIYEDFKGFMTPLAKWKLKHFEAEYGIKVRITGRAR